MLNYAYIYSCEVNLSDWRAVGGFEGLYECNELGEFRTVNTRRGAVHQRPRKLYRGPRGYLAITLCKDGKYHTKYAHRLIAAAFIGESNLTVNHKNGDKADNRPCNLEYLTKQENSLHACRVLGIGVGERHWNAKLRQRDVDEIRKLRADGWQLKALAAKFGVSDASISMICAGLKWRAT